jgi:hypothetical protein
MLKHDRNAVLHRIVAAATSAVKPGVGAIARARGKRLMTCRASEKLEQCLGKRRRHLMILDPFTMNTWL